MSERVLLLGSTSGIGRALSRALARAGRDLVLAGRNQGDLERDAADLHVRYGVRVEVRSFDAQDFASHEELLEACTGNGAHLDGVVACHGLMEEQEEAQGDPDRARRMIDVNLASVVSVLERAAPYFEQRRRGWICAISSVAGDRGRRSNYLYGATKAGLSAYLEGLDARLSAVGVPVITVKPGYVDTHLTYGRPGLLPAASPERVAADVLRAIERGRRVVYTPWYWRGILLGLRLLPRALFRRLPI